MEHKKEIRTESRHFRLTTTLLKLLQREAEVQRRSLQNVFTIALEDYLERRKLDRRVPRDHTTV